MHNIATIYRFNTPFLDISQERDNLISVIKKIEKSLELDGIIFEKDDYSENNYYVINLNLVNNLWKISFKYINKVSDNLYHLPLFILDISLDNKFLLSNSLREKTVKFLNNVFECFDWLTEKDFLIDIDNTIYYTKWLFKTKFYPNYDFSDIEIIKEAFEDNDWELLLEDFIKRFSNKNFELSLEKKDYYYKLHSIFLYFIYLVYTMQLNLDKTMEAENELKTDLDNVAYNSHKKLMSKRLQYTKDIHLKVFEQYKNRLELFFKMF